ncbi:LacI family DNA-binding transcriptional regulator [Cryobacterium tepidiphilum]|uniref:LacI family transcriptional regulator n=1 Tax=Cryobacterium tepidiphilum TaxID=2486026 RepID=A0A3M8KTX3_9MICO|nr:LacI family DNA-binding transcriptional regulator [Cryobacterium tepidiphilum]RNE56515.1 LacI family transcriptional regulator [Cryobacterium tepidiphilum]
MTEINRSPATLLDVAREAGVSLATASRALNGSDRKVNDSYRERVLAAAARLNYSPNLSAQAVAKGSTNTVALLVSDIADPYFSSIAAGVIRASDDAGLVVTIAVTGRDSARELELVRALRGQRPRIMILTGSRSADQDNEQALVDELTAFEANGGRVVMVSQGELPFDTVVLDNYEGARLLAHALVDRGYRRFAAIAATDALLTVKHRLGGFRQGLAERDLAITDEHVVRSEFTRDGGYAGAMELLDRGIDEVDCVFALNDVMAVGALSAFRAAGRVPGRDIAVAGFDDIPTVQDVSPALTTVHVPMEDVGELALSVAVSKRSGDATTTPVATSVVVRESTPQR